MEEYLSLKEWSFPLTWWFELNELQPVPNPVVFCRITEKGTLKAWWFWTKLLHNYWCLLGCPEYQVVGIHSQPHARAVLQSKWPSMSPKNINKWNYNKTIKICEKSALLGWSGNFVFTYSVGFVKVIELSCIPFEYWKIQDVITNTRTCKCKCVFICKGLFFPCFSSANQ